jgi:TP901 family phage tail tape measure protein
MPGRAVAYTFKAIDKFTAIATRIKQKTKGMGRSFDQLGAKATKAGKKLKAIGGSLRTMSMGAGIAVGGSLKAFSDMERGITNVLTLMDKPDIHKFGGQLKNLSQDAVMMGFGIGDANTALFDTVSAMGANEASFEAFAVGQKLAIAGCADLSVAVDGITSIMNAYGKETTGANEVANAFFSAQKAGKTTVAKLASTVGAVAPMAKTAGVGFKELLATISQLTLGGLSTEESVVGVKGALTALLNPGKEAEGILSQLGVPIGATQIRAAGLSGTLAKLADVAEKYPDLLNKAIPNIRGFTAVAALSADAIKNIGVTMNTIDRDIAQGTGMMAGYEMQMGTFAQETAMTWGSVKILASEIGQVLAPAMRKVGEGVRWLVVKFRGLGDTWKSVIGWVTAFIASVSTIAISLGTFLGVIGKTSAAVAVFKAPFVALAAPVGWLATGLAGLKAIAASVVFVFGMWPAIIAGVVAAVMGLGYAIYKNWSALKKFFGFGGEEPKPPPAWADMQMDLEATRKTMTQIDVNVMAKKGTAADVEAKTKWKYQDLDVATNLVTES